MATLLRPSSSVYQLKDSECPFPWPGSGTASGSTTTATSTTSTSKSTDSIPIYDQIKARYSAVLYTPESLAPIRHFAHDLILCSSGAPHTSSSSTTTITTSSSTFTSSLSSSTLPLPSSSTSHMTTVQPSARPPALLLDLQQIERKYRILFAAAIERWILTGIAEIPTPASTPVTSEQTQKVTHPSSSLLEAHRNSGRERGEKSMTEKKTRTKTTINGKEIRTGQRLSRFRGERTSRSSSRSSRDIPLPLPIPVSVPIDQQQMDDLAQGLSVRANCVSSTATSSSDWAGGGDVGGNDVVWSFVRRGRKNVETGVSARNDGESQMDGLGPREGEEEEGDGSDLAEEEARRVKEEKKEREVKQEEEFKKAVKRKSKELTDGLERREVMLQLLLILDHLHAHSYQPSSSASTSNTVVAPVSAGNPFPSASASASDPSSRKRKSRDSSSSSFSTTTTLSKQDYYDLWRLADMLTDRLVVWQVVGGHEPELDTCHNFRKAGGRGRGVPTVNETGNGTRTSGPEEDLDWVQRFCVEIVEKHFLSIHPKFITRFHLKVFGQPLQKPPTISSRPKTSTDRLSSNGTSNTTNPNANATTSSRFSRSSSVASTSAFEAAAAAARARSKSIDPEGLIDAAAVGGGAGAGGNACGSGSVSNAGVGQNNKKARQSGGLTRQSSIKDLFKGRQVGLCRTISSSSSNPAQVQGTSNRTTMNGSMSGIPGFGPLFDKRANMEMITGKRKTMFVPRVQSVSEENQNQSQSQVSLNLSRKPIPPPQPLATTMALVDATPAKSRIHTTKSFTTTTFNSSINNSSNNSNNTYQIPARNLNAPPPFFMSRPAQTIPIPMSTSTSSLSPARPWSRPDATSDAYPVPATTFVAETPQPTRTAPRFSRVTPFAGYLGSTSPSLPSSRNENSTSLSNLNSIDFSTEVDQTPLETFMVDSDDEEGVHPGLKFNFTKGSTTSTRARPRPPPPTFAVDQDRDREPETDSVAETPMKVTMATIRTRTRR